MGIIMTTKELRPREKDDHYPTPFELCRAALNKFGFTNFKHILDPGCGTGVWGEAAKVFWPDSILDGVDIVDRLPINHQYDYLHIGDYRSFDGFGGKYDLIMGNPPYVLAEEFIEKSYELLDPHGILLFLLRLNFLEGQKRGRGLWKTHKPSDIYVCSRRPSYTGDGKTDATAYMICCWGDTTDTTTQLEWLDWNYDDQST